MFSTNTKALTLFVAAITVLAVAAVLTDGSNADTTDDTYRFYLNTTAEGYDDSICGWYTGTGSTTMAAFCNALDQAKITYTGFNAESASVYFSDKAYFSDWISTWNLHVDEYGLNYGANFSIWNYNTF